MTGEYGRNQSQSGLVTLNVNGSTFVVRASDGTSLLRVLRGELGLLGVRQGCGIGECGACTVLVDGVATRACITPWTSVQGTAIRTPEGLGGPDSLHPIQEAFLNEEAAQCGFCINGIIMTTAGLLQRNPDPSDDEIDGSLVEHICRCGTHNRIVRAIKRAAGRPQARKRGVYLTQSKRTSAPSTAQAPAIVRRYPRVEDWLAFDESAGVVARTGKVEIGQGVRQAMAAIVARELDVDEQRVRVVSPTTELAPDEGYTAGSASIEQGGTALAMAGAAARRLLMERASRVLGVSVSELTWSKGGAHGAGVQSLSLRELAQIGDLTGRILETDQPVWIAGTASSAVVADDGHPLAAWKPGPRTGTSGATAWAESVLDLDLPARGSPRKDLIAKLSGAPAYVHDLTMPEMLYARALLPPVYGALLTDLPACEVGDHEGVVAIHRQGNLVLVIAESPGAADRAVTRLARSAGWEGTELPRCQTDWLDHRRTPDVTVASHGDPNGILESAPNRCAASYTKPYEAHAALAPSCAVALLHDARMLDDSAQAAPQERTPPVSVEAILEVWTHSQGIYPLRREIAAALRRPEGSVVVHHTDGPGCYGHNAADDAAGFAAIAATVTPSRPVRFQFTVEEEFTWEPYGTAMRSELAAALDDAGRINAWRHEVRTDVHSARPNGDGDRLMLSWLARGKRLPTWSGSAEPGYRNAVPIYRFPATLVEASYRVGPLRVSALRTLGAYMNVFSIESFMDELAHEAGRDPVAFRLEHLRDERARNLMLTAVDAAGWEPAPSPTGMGIGMAVSRYKGVKAYVATVIKSAVDASTGRIRVERMVCACDAGYVVDEEGLRNQVEGGALQALSRALHEEVRFGPEGIRTRDWTTYPVLRFAETPHLEVVVVDGGGPPLGAGEAATPPVPAALANSIFDGTGIRLRDLPFTEARVRQRLMNMTEAELSRVIL